MEPFVDFVLGETVYLSPEGLVRILGVVIIIECIAMFAKAFRF